jgi:ACS family hexuronate transporter-like MFS transporter
MTPGRDPLAPHIDPWRWGVVWLMFLATMINYMDRQAMQVTSSHIIAEFTPQFIERGYGPEEGYGVVESVFNFAFAASQIIAGLIADRLRLRWVYAVALLVWSAAGLFTGLAETLTMLFACRIILGFGEAFNWPCAVHVVKRVMPHESRSLANGIFHSGASIGAAVMPLLAVALLSPVVGGQADPRWRWLFIGVGALGGMWALLWFWLIRGRRAEVIEHPATEEIAARAQTDVRPPFWEVFTLQKFWLALAFGTSVNLFWHFLRVWLPRILKTDLKLGENEMLLTVTGFFVAADVGSMIAGWTTRRLTRSGFSIVQSRKFVMIGTSSLCLLTVPAVWINRPEVSLPLIILSAAGAMGGFANYFALTQDVSPHHTSFVVGIVGAVPWFVLADLHPRVGRWADRTGSFALAVFAVACVPLTGALIASIWPESSKEAPSPTS